MVTQELMRPALASWLGAAAVARAFIAEAALCSLVAQISLKIQPGVGYPVMHILHLRKKDA